MDKQLNSDIKNLLFKYISIIFNVSEHSEIMLAIQLINAKEYFYEIVKILEKISNHKKSKFYTIDLDFEDFGMSEIDENGKYVIPSWLENKKHSIIFVYNIDSLNRRNYKLKQLDEILKGSIQNIPIPANKHFILLSDKEDLSEPNIIRLDIKKALEITNKKVGNEDRKSFNIY